MELYYLMQISGIIHSSEYKNALSQMLVTLLGMVTEVKLLQLLNALSPMLVTLLGMVTEVKFQQLSNAHAPMLVTLLGMVTLDAEPL
jgi:membrane-associated HD superfamily phosphohydrolase